MKYLQIVLATLLILATGLFLVFYQATDGIGDPTFRKVTLTSKDHTTNLYIKAKNWGVTDDNQLTVVSVDSEKEFEADSTKEFIFYGLEPFLYKVKNDSLILLVRQKAIVPVNFTPKWTIIQLEIENSEFMTKRMNGEYEKM